MPIEHLTTGSKNPPLVEGQLRLYSMRFCPYAQRVHLVLNAKDVPYDAVFINLVAKPEWYIQLVPTTKVPALSFDGVNLYESLIVSDYLDEKFSQVPLHSKDPLQKAKDRILIEDFNKVIGTVYKLFSLEIVDDSTLENFLTTVDPFEKELIGRGQYFSGSAPGMVDYMIWPWFERFPLLAILVGPNITLPSNRFPKLLDWGKLMLEDKAVKKHYLTPEQHAHHFRMRRNGTPNYEII